MLTDPADWKMCLPLQRFFGDEDRIRFLAVARFQSGRSTLARLKECDQVIELARLE